MYNNLIKKITSLFVWVAILFNANTSYSQEYYSIYKLNGDNTSFETINSIQDFPTFESVEFEGLGIGGSYQISRYGDYHYVISQDNFNVLKYDINFSELIHSFGSSGRGPGEGSYIHAFSINSESILLFDSGLRKMTGFDRNGKLIFEKNVQDQQFPYNITSLEHIYADVYLAVGISMEEWNRFKQGRAYKNVYLLKINPSTLEVLDSKSIIPPNILRGIQSQDVIASTVSNPFRLTKTEDEIFLFNYSSAIVYNLEVVDKNIEVKYAVDLTKKYFLEHPEISQDDFNQDALKRQEWINNGNFLLNIFKNNDRIIFYLSDIIEAGHAIYPLIICDIKTFNVQEKFILEVPNIMRDIYNNKMHFLSFDHDLEMYVYAKISLNDLIGE